MIGAMIGFVIIHHLCAFRLRKSDMNTTRNGCLMTALIVVFTASSALAETPIRRRRLWPAAHPAHRHLP
jgi:hypothetical protein